MWVTKHCPKQSLTQNKVEYETKFHTKFDAKTKFRYTHSTLKDTIKTNTSDTFDGTVHHSLSTYHTSRFRIGRRLVGDFHASHFSFPFRTVLVKRRQTRVFRDDRGGLSVHALKAGQDGTAKKSTRRKSKRCVRDCVQVVPDKKIKKP